MGRTSEARSFIAQPASDLPHHQAVPQPFTNAAWAQCRKNERGAHYQNRDTSDITKHGHAPVNYGKARTPWLHIERQPGSLVCHLRHQLASTVG